MLLYKFRTLKNIEFALDIILNERLHCASYNQLNDPFEGLFHTVLYSYNYPPNYPLFFNTNEVKGVREVNDLPIKLRHCKICSLSKNLNDVRLWSHYADGHKGIAIELDFCEIESDVHKVNYVEKLPEFEDTNLNSLSPIELLTFKTKHWEYEEEYRIIDKKDYYPIKGRIKSIYAGHRTSKLHASLLDKIIPKQIPIIPNELNTERIIVEPI